MPGCSLGIIRNGKFLYKKGYGLANALKQEPNTSSTKFDIASITKQFTAACIALLHFREMLSIEHPVNEYLPELKIDQRIKIKHLVYHESGLKDFIFSLLMLDYSWEEIEGLTEDTLFNILKKLPELDFEPGCEHNYTNTNYFLLGLIVEKVSGKKLSEFANEEIFVPLGMKDTSFETNFDNISSKKAVGYSLQPHRSKEEISKAQILGPRGVYTTIDDLFKWDQNFYSAKIGGRKLIAMLEKPSQEKIIGMSPKRWQREQHNQGYAFGLLIDYYRGLRVIRHGGDFAGYTAEMMRFPEKQLTVIVLSNINGINPTASAFKVADVILDGEIEIPSPFKDRPKLDIKNKNIDSLVGTYCKPEYNSLLSIYRSENKIMLENDWQRAELKAIAERTFVADINNSMLWVYQKDNSIIVENEFYNAELKKIYALDFEKKQLDEYIGRFHNEKFDKEILIETEGKNLKFNLNFGEQQLSPVFPDTFRNRFLKLEFVRLNDEISSVNLTSAGAKDISYIKTNTIKKK